MLSLKVIHRRRRTGFEETKDFPIRVSDLIAGRYQARLFWLFASVLQPAPHPGNALPPHINLSFLRCCRRCVMIVNFSSNEGPIANLPVKQVIHCKEHANLQAGGCASSEEKRRKGLCMRVRQNR